MAKVLSSTLLSLSRYPNVDPLSRSYSEGYPIYLTNLIISPLVSK